MDRNLKLRSDIQFFPFGGELVHVYDPVARRHFKMGKQEASWMLAVDGTRSRHDLQDVIPHEHFEEFLSNLGRMALLEGSTIRRRFDLLKIKRDIFNPNRFLDKRLSLCILYRQLLTVFSAPLALVNLVIVSLAAPLLGHALSKLHFGWQTVLGYFLAVAVVGTAHELSHAVVAKSRGANVPVIGAMLFYFQPAFFTDISGIGLLTSRWHRIEVLLAGVEANNFLASLCLLGFFLTQGTDVSNFLAALVFLNGIIAVVNLIPFVEYDGFFIFLELLGDPQFGHRARLAVHPAFRKTEYVLYFALSQVFAFSLVLSAALNVRSFALNVWNSPVVDYLSIVLMLLGCFAVVRRNGPKRAEAR